MMPLRTYVPDMGPSPITADELRLVRAPGADVELVRGVLVVREPPGFRHGRIAVALAARLDAHIRAAASEMVVVAESGFKLASTPDTVRGLDLAVVRRDRLSEPDPAGFPDLAPDLVVEIASPGDRVSDLLGRVAEWLEAGSRLIWVIDPERRVAHVYRAGGSRHVVAAGQVLGGEDVLPGFTCPLTDIL